MRIGFDVSQTGKAKAGCGYFADGLIRQLAATDTRNEYILYPAVGDFFWDPACKQETFACQEPNFQRLDPPRDFPASQQFWRNPPADFEARLGHPDIFHANNFFCPRSLKNARLVYTTYDLSFLQEPKWTTEENRIGCLHGVFEASIRADWILAISEFTRRHFLDTFPHYPRERSSVIYPASRFPDSLPALRSERLAMLESARFWLSVGTIEPRKNHRSLLEAYSRLRSAMGSAYPLVLAGGRGWLMEAFLDDLRSLELGRDVILTGYVSDAELKWLYQNCFAFVYPSLFEGFGMPVLEALGLGAPVLCSNTSSLPEAAGDAAVLFDPSDPLSIAKEMIRFARGEVGRESLQSAGLEQAKKFSWARSAARLLELYEQVVASPRMAAIPAPGGGGGGAIQARA
ncbi:MAG: glycosyltransferase family 4 protein [Acidobacteriia bacterium]|nr:glycosyltransferase family 4 protein [Terriglobia bacterium]